MSRSRATVAVPGRRTGRDGWSAAAAVLIALAIMALGSVLFFRATPVIDPGGAVHIVTAERLDASQGLGAKFPPAANAGWQPVTLPDNWDSTRQGIGGGQQTDSASYVWYRLKVPAHDFYDAGRGQLALYLPAVGMNAQVFVNGVDLGSAGSMQEPVSRNFYTPLMFNLPRSLLGRDGRGDLVHILVAGYPQHRNGLGDVFIGTDMSLRPAWRWRSFWQNTGTLISSVLTVALGAYVLMLWARERRNAVFGWFGLAAVVWGIRNLNLVVTDLPLPNLLWSQLGVVGAVGFVGFFALFTLRYCESYGESYGASYSGSCSGSGSAQAPGAGGIDWTAPRWQIVLVWCFMVVASLALLLPDTFQQTRANFRWVGFFGVALTCWTQLKLTSLAWHSRTTETALIAAAGMIYIALMLHDYQVTNDKRMLGQYYLRQYAALPLFIAVGSMLTRRYLTALERAHHMAASLAAEVKVQHDRLALNFQQLREAENRQVQAHERERLMRDLHDGLGLHLLSALMQARSATPDPAVMTDILQDCLDDLRVAVDSLAGDERDPATILGSLRFRMAPRIEAAGLQLEWDVDGEIPELDWLDPEKSLQLLRIVQEALTNAIRHSGATAIRIALRQTAGTDGAAVVEVSVRDNGQGFDAAAQGSFGRGVMNMRARAQRMGAELRIESATGSGTRVVLALPVLIPPAAQVAGVPATASPRA
ncbi:MAG: hypothetical protein EOO28_13765 [Comamonadaceae bacterium]|nr:MAG: hypothetical protein EOO28_13765 [Comamonadaceae bacterium]